MHMGVQETALILRAGGVPGRCRGWLGTCAPLLMLHGLPSQVSDARAVCTLLGMP